jgi:hypothetical protein
MVDPGSILLPSKWATASAAAASRSITLALRQCGSAPSSAEQPAFFSAD